jgi:hypothetical protein
MPTIETRRSGCERSAVTALAEFVPHARDALRV